MPNLLTTALAAIRYPSAANNGAEFAEGIENLADDIDLLTYRLFDEVTTTQYTASATYADLGTVGPSLTIPATGDWLITFGALIAAQDGSGYMGLAVGASAASDARSVQVGGVATDLSADVVQLQVGASVSRTIEVAAVQGDEIVAKYKRATLAASPSFSYRWMRAELLRLP